MILSNEELEKQWYQKNLDLQLKLRNEHTQEQLANFQKLEQSIKQAVYTFHQESRINLELEIHLEYRTSSEGMAIKPMYLAFKEVYISFRVNNPKPNET